MLHAEIMFLQVRVSRVVLAICSLVGVGLGPRLLGLGTARHRARHGQQLVDERLAQGNGSWRGTPVPCSVGVHQV